MDDTVDNLSGGAPVTCVDDIAVSKDEVAASSSTSSPKLRTSSHVEDPSSYSDDLPSATSTDSNEEETVVSVASSSPSCALAEIGFLFESNHATTQQIFTWEQPALPPSSPPRQTTTVATPTRGKDDGSSRQKSNTTSDSSNNINKKLTVGLERNDAEPGAVQSGHYLWPAAELLLEYLIRNDSETARALRQMRVSSMVELGAGCALVSLAALQLWQTTLQCVVTTDHDPSVLERARTNYETTLEHKLDESVTEDQFHATINNLASIPVCFETLEWGNRKEIQLIRNLILEHTMATMTTTTTGQSPEQTSQSLQQSVGADLIVGSDLIYCHDVVEPLLQTASQLLSCRRTLAPSTYYYDPEAWYAPRFVLSQSFAYDEQTEQAIEEVCDKFQLQRAILWEEDNGQKRIQEFRRRRLSPLSTPTRSREEDEPDRGMSEASPS